MSEENRSPIVKLGYWEWNQYSVFKSHLMLPFPYLKVIVKNYRDLTEVPIILPRLITRIDAHLWSLMEEIKNADRIFRAKGIPVPYLRDTGPITAGVKVTKACEMVLADIHKFVHKPIVLHMHSGFENAALRAASMMVKTAIVAGIDARMLNFGDLISETKEWDDTNEVLVKAKAVQLLCLFMVGREYKTDFTKAVLDSILAERAVQGKVTLITSHMDPAAFVKRYGFELQAVALKFDDDKVTSTVDDLIAYMKA